MINIKKNLGLNICIVLFVVFLIVLGYTILNKDDLINIQETKQKNIREYYSNNTSSFTMYYADWCPHCVDTKPHFKKLMDSTWKNKVSINMVDCEKDKKTAEAEGIEGFPTIKFVKNNKQVMYEGERTYSGFNTFLKENV